MKKTLLFALFSLLFTFLLVGCAENEGSATLIFEVDGTVYHEQTHPADESFTAPAAPSKETALFGGWYYDNGKWQEPFDLADFNKRREGKTYRVYARWETVELTLAEDKRSYTVTGILPSFEGKADIPAKYKDLPIAAIADGVFKDRTDLISVKIPDTVQTIGNMAFAGCTSLTEITLPNSVTVLGNGVFSGCTALKSVSLASTVKKISPSAFEDCTSLEGITLYDGLTDIGYRAFAGCTSLKTVALPSTLKVVSDSAFRGCTSLTSVTIPARVENIGAYAFSDATALSAFSFASGSRLSSIGEAFLSGSAVKTLVLPDAPDAVVSARAFLGISTLSSLTLGKVRFLSNGTFEGVALSEISFSGSMETWEQMTVLNASLFDESNVERVICTDGVLSLFS